MSNLSVRHKEAREAREVRPWTPSMDPFRMIRSLLGADPFAGLVSPVVEAFVPDIEIKETADAYVIQADLPGVREEDLDVSITGNRLTVSGKREEEERREEDQFFAYERSYGMFSRAFTLPDEADRERVSADLTQGVLRVVVPKKAEMQARKVEIGGGRAKGQASEGAAERPKKAA